MSQSWFTNAESRRKLQYGLTIAAFLLVIFFIRISQGRSTQKQLDHDPEKPIIAIVDGKPVYESRTLAAAGFAIEPAPAVPNFTLLSHEEQPVTLSDFQGKYILLFFGYTHCPDVCPLTLDGFRRIYAELDDAQRKQLVLLFISVDGARDTPQRLRHYLKAFNLPIIALSGSHEEVRRAGEVFGLVWEIVPSDSERAAELTGGHSHKHAADDNQSYLIDHTSSRFLVDPNGNLIRRYLYDPNPEISAKLILEDLRPLLND